MKEKEKIEERDNIINETPIIGEKNKDQTMQFNIELLTNNIIVYHNVNKNAEKIEQKILQSEIELIVLEIPIIKEINFNNNLLEENNYDDFHFKLEDIINNLKKKGYPLLPSSKLYIYIDYYDNYVLVDNEKNFVYSSMLPEKNKIKLKLENLIDNLSTTDTGSILKNYFLQNEKKEKKISHSATCRVRKIKDIIKIVLKFRFLLNGFFDYDEKYIKYTTSDVSERMNIPKKTLQDYLRQINEARKTGFDFNKYKNKSISFLRKHNRKNKKNKNIKLADE